MTKQEKPMEKFDFLLGSWDMEYRIPKSALSEAATGTGSGTFKRALDDQYVFFDYVCSITEDQGQAYGIFVWDEKAKLYRYWWFESSGNFLSATCNFINDKTLAMNWHDSLLVQTFVNDGPDKVILKMQYPSANDGYDLVMEVIFTRK